MKHLTQSENQTSMFGQKLAKLLPSQAIIELIGDIGAGKTTLTKGLARGLGVSEIVQSPSFTIFSRYESKKGSLHHYDFYRLKQPGLMSQSLTESLAEPGAIVLIEWAELVADLLPRKRITIRLTPRAETSRLIEVSGLTR